MDYENDPGWKYLRMSRDELTKEMNKPYDSKSDCWIPDANEGFVAANIKEIKGDIATVMVKGGTEQQVKKDLIQEMNPPKFTKSEDMANLSFLNDASVLWNLRDRYSSMLIYTYSGLFCVVINPYKRLPIYTDSVARIYIGKRKNEVPPHLWAVSDEAYRNMLQDRECQSMLITGESGAGKTENTKKVIAYFAALGQQQAEQAGQKVEGGEKKVSLEEQIVQTNPVLEAFGNAKTVRNNNSSRFGKFIRIHFTKDGRVSGCDIEHYLLEKSRVIRQAPGERCYHIFYQIMSGHDPSLCKTLEYDKKPTEYWYISQAETTIKGVNDKEEYAMTDEAFDILHFPKEDKLNCYKLVAAIVHMGDMKFKEKKEQAEPDGKDEAIKAATMFGVTGDDLLNAFCKPRVKVGKEWVRKGQNAEQVNWARGAMSKGLYARMFDWLVAMCNKTLDARELPRIYFIGVLDIAGFEIFDFNSFEQLWINFVNEKLQQFFNHHMFVLEQEEYAREGIEWTFIDFGLDLAACIELIEKPMGIISMLDEECIVPKATDLTYAQKLMDQHVGKHPNIEKPKPPKGKQAEAHFALKHYAGLVRYNVSAWLEKNKDPLNDTVVEVLKTSKGNDLGARMWNDYTTQVEQEEILKAGGERKKGKSASMMTVSMKYRESLNNLMTMLNKTHPHFIRCLIPNEKKQSGLLEAELVLNQLTCNGVLEGIRICRKGFPNRMQHADVKFRYAILAPAEAKSASDDIGGSKAIMAKIVKDGKLTNENFKVGKTKVFFKAGILARMEDFRDEKLSSILTGLQAQMRWYGEQRRAKRKRDQIAAMKVLQSNIGSWIMLRTWEWYILLVKAKDAAYMAKESERLQELLDKVAELEKAGAEEDAKRKELDETITKLNASKTEILAEMDKKMAGYAEMEEKVKQQEEEKEALKTDITKLQDDVAAQEERSGDVVRARKQVEREIDDLKKSLQDVEMSLRKVESEKASKDHQIRTLQEEMATQDGSIAKLSKERKHLEEAARKLTEDLQAEEDKVNHANKVVAKLETTLEDLDAAIERERRNKQETEKEKRKLEGENKVALETLDELNRAKQDTENQLRRKESELHAMASRLEDTQSQVGKLQRQIKEMQARIQELEEELESERASRSKSDRQRSDLQAELEDLNNRLDEAGGATAAQIEMNKKREAELAQLRRDLEEANVQHDNQLGALRKKHNDAVAEMSDQLDQLEKQKSKTEKDRLQQQRQIEELNAQLDAESRSKQNLEKLSKQLEGQIMEAQSKVEEQERQIQDFALVRNRLGNENQDLLRQADDLNQQVDQFNRLKSTMVKQLDELRRAAEDEGRERQSLNAQLKNLQHEVDTMRDQVDEETSSKEEVLRQVQKAQQESQQWKSRFESEGQLKADEIEESKRKIHAKIKDLQEQLEGANTKIANLEKVRARMAGELDDAQVEIERTLGIANNLEKKEQSFEATCQEWKQKHDDLNSELDASQREARALGADSFKLKSANDEIVEQLEALRRENKNLSHEIKDLSDQLTEGGRSAHEMQKMVRRLEIEKEELQTALDEAENNLQAEESKVQRAQVEVAQIRQEIEKRIAEKEEEFDATRKNHARALESMQASLETEARSRAELARMKKKLESDINELEIALDHANKANSDAQKNLRRFQEQIKELQMQIEDEQRQKDEARESLASAERRLAALMQEKDELRHELDNNERVRKQAEMDAQEARDQANELTAQNGNLQASKRKAESEIAALNADVDETVRELKASEENAKRAMSDAARLAEELRQEQEHASHVERMRQGLENQIRDMQVRLEDAEQAALKGGKKTIAKLESRIREIESELDGEQRRHAETNKGCSRSDRRLREIQFQIDENKKGADRLNDLIEKLQQKLKLSKRQVEEAEELATTNLQKYRQLQCALDDAEERADTAENNLSKLRAKSRTAASVAPAHSGSVIGRSASRGGF